jgi:hypothetical protein
MDIDFEKKPDAFNKKYIQLKDADSTGYETLSANQLHEPLSN